ncbi:hypothetical protein GJ697_25450 [Pseudoduganella sp. FT25W]|uniref:Esterase n=1 Tax=Duganella alba TaxID=2666081 RepID=A0A6L5QNJ0_9BURK|nr:alpha/beta hydrolase-fold protein [Duganella alba]MRX11175.1 hypothetical protein [Duganella alba]MRX19354.1 hypothetical protein [Duganella alba]
MHKVVAALLLLSTMTTPTWAASKKIAACTGPDDRSACLIEGEAPDRSQLPAAGPAAWISGDRLVISWVGEADEVHMAGNMQLAESMPRVAPGLFQYMVRYPKAQQARVQLRFVVEKNGDSEMTPKMTELVGPEAFAILSNGDIKEETMVFSPQQPEVHVWLPPGYRPGTRLPILYLADGGWTSPGAWLTEPIRRGEIPPLIVVGIEYGPKGQMTSDLRMVTYLGDTEVKGQLEPEFVAHERFLLDTVIPAIEAKYGAPPERRLRAVGGASNGGVWAASMALRNPGVFGTAFVMSPGVPPAQHGAARPLSRFYVSAGDLEPSFRRNARCVAQDIVQRGGVATFATYPSGHDYWMWGRILLDNTRDWLNPHPAALPARQIDSSSTCAPTT